MRRQPVQALLLLAFCCCYCSWSLLVAIVPAVLPPKNTTSRLPNNCSFPSSQPSLNDAEVRTGCMPAATAPSSVYHAYQQLHRFAPYIWQHPEERFRLDDIRRFLAAATVYDGQDGSIVGAATEENFIEWYRNGVDTSQYFVSASNFDYSGSTVTESGETTAPIYANVFYNATRNTFVFNYWLWFSFNGCSNQQLDYYWATSKDANLSDVDPDSDDVDELTMDYLLCDVGIHEGDFELVAVEVCADLSSVLEVQYNYHSWSQVLDCTADQCLFYRNSTHPLAFIALHSHSPYPYQANFIYLQAHLDLINIRFFNLVDRAFASSNGSFVPSRTNVIAVYSPEQYDLAAESSSSSFLNTTWMLFAGTFGITAGSEKTINPPTCLSDQNQTASRCQNIFWSETITSASILFYDALVAEDIDVDEHFTSLGPAALWTQPEFSQFVGLKGTPPVTRENISCPNPRQYIGSSPDDLVDTSALGGGVNIGMLLGGIFIVVGLAIIVLMWIIIALCMDHDYSVRRLLLGLPYIGMLSSVSTAIGIFLMMGPIDDTLNLLNNIVNSSIFDMIDVTLSVLGVLVGVVVTSTLLLSFALIPPVVQLLERRRKPGEQASESASSARGGVRPLRLLVVAVAFLLVLSGALALAFFTLALVVFGAQILIGLLCRNLLPIFEILRGICLDLSAIGLKSLKCGAPFVRFCNSVSAISTVSFIAGSVIYALAVYLLMIQSGIMIEQLRTLGVFRKKTNIEMKDLSG